MTIEPFLTAYDPSDLPGGSVDPLGFERGYLFLADKILPGLTNVADRPRYFAVLCAGASLIEDDAASTPRKLAEMRLERVLRLERLWGLASVLAIGRRDVNGSGEQIVELGGLRGVTYYQAQADRVTREARPRVDARFTVLSRQLRYGAVGIYGAIAQGLRLWDRRLLSPTADLGMRLAEAFWEETEAPESLKRAVRDDGDVGVAQLTSWGERSHIAGRVSRSEAKCFSESLHWDDVRSRMVASIQGTPWLDDEADDELARLARLAARMERQAANADLYESIQGILAYEAVYRVVLLGFERLLWLARTLPSGAVGAPDIAADPVIQRVREKLRESADAFIGALDSGKTPHFCADLARLADVRAFLVQAAGACTSSTSLVDAIASRHADVQRGKFDRGRRKMPWVERGSGGFSLTSARVGGLDFEAIDPSQIQPHPYRLGAADRFLAAASAA